MKELFYSKERGKLHKVFKQICAYILIFALILPIFPTSAMAQDGYEDDWKVDVFEDGSDATTMSRTGYAPTGSMNFRGKVQKVYYTEFKNVEEGMGWSKHPGGTYNLADEIIRIRAYYDKKDQTIYWNVLMKGDGSGPNMGVAKDFSRPNFLITVSRGLDAPSGIFVSNGKQMIAHYNEDWKKNKALIKSFDIDDTTEHYVTVMGRRVLGDKSKFNDLLQNRYRVSTGDEREESMPYNIEKYNYYTKYAMKDRMEGNGNSNTRIYSFSTKINDELYSSINTPPNVKSDFTNYMGWGEYRNDVDLSDKVWITATISSREAAGLKITKPNGQGNYDFSKIAVVDLSPLKKNKENYNPYYEQKTGQVNEEVKVDIKEKDNKKFPEGTRFELESDPKPNVDINQSNGNVTVTNVEKKDKTFMINPKTGQVTVKIPENATNNQELTDKVRVKYPNGSVATIDVKVVVKDKTAPIIKRGNFASNGKNVNDKLDGQKFQDVYIGDDVASYKYEAADESGFIKNFDTVGPLPSGTTLDGASKKDGGAYDKEGQRLVRTLKLKADKKAKTGDFSIGFKAEDNANNSVTVNNSGKIKTYLPVAKKKLEVQNGGKLDSPADAIGIYYEKYEDNKKAELINKIKTNPDKSKIKDKDNFMPENASYTWKNKIDTTKTGERKEIAVVTYTDNKGKEVKEEVEVTVNVIGPKKSKEEVIAYEPNNKTDPTNPKDTNVPKKDKTGAIIEEKDYNIVAFKTESKEKATLTKDDKKDVEIISMLIKKDTTKTFKDLKPEVKAKENYKFWYWDKDPQDTKEIVQDNAKVQDKEVYTAYLIKNGQKITEDLTKTPLPKENGQDSVYVLELKKGNGVKANEAYGKYAVFKGKTIQETGINIPQPQAEENYKDAKYYNNTTATTPEEIKTKTVNANITYEAKAVSSKFNKDKITKIEIKKQPELNYTEGENGKDELDLSKLVVTLTDENGNTKEVEYKNFKDYGITTSPSDKTKLTQKEHNNKKIKITKDKIGTETDPLKVNKKATIADKFANGEIKNKDFSVWIGENLQTEKYWKKGVELKEGLDETTKKELEKYLDNAKSFEDLSKRTSTQAVDNPEEGRIKVVFEDDSYVVVEKQKLYVKNPMLAETDTNAPTDAISVKFLLGEGVEAGENTNKKDGNKEKPVLYQTYKIKPGVNVQTENHPVTHTTLLNMISPKAKEGYINVQWKSKDAKSFVVNKDNDEFTAFASKKSKEEVIAYEPNNKTDPTNPKDTNVPKKDKTGAIIEEKDYNIVAFKTESKEKATLTKDDKKDVEIISMLIKKDTTKTFKDLKPEVKAKENYKFWYWDKDPQDTKEIVQDNAKVQDKEVYTAYLIKNGQKITEDLTKTPLPKENGQDSVYVLELKKGNGVKANEAYGKYAVFKGKTIQETGINIPQPQAEENYKDAKYYNNTTATTPEEIKTKTVNANITYEAKAVSSKFNKDKITKIEIKKQPELNYTEGENGKDELDLSKLVVTLTDENGNTKEVEYKNFKDYGITTSPSDKTKLTQKEHNNKKIKITKDKIGTETDPLKVNKKATIADKFANGEIKNKDFSVWIGENLQTEKYWKKGVELKEGLDETTKKELEKYLDNAKSFEDLSKRTSTQAVDNPEEGRIKVVFEDDSYVVVEKQKLYVKNPMLAETDTNAPTDAISVKFLLGEGVEAGENTNKKDGNKEKPVLYQTYKIKPGVNVQTENHPVTHTTLLNMISPKAKEGYINVQWKSKDAKSFVVNKDNDEFTAFASEKSKDEVIAYEPSNPQKPIDPQDKNVPKVGKDNKPIDINEYVQVAFKIKDEDKNIAKLELGEIKDKQQITLLVKKNIKWEKVTKPQVKVTDVNKTSNGFTPQLPSDTEEVRSGEYTANIQDKQPENKDFDKDNIVDIKVTKDPDKMEYTEKTDDKLKLDGIEIELKDKNGKTVKIGKDKIKEYNITVTPAENDTLTNKDNDKKKIKVKVTIKNNGNAEEKTVETQKQLTVKKQDDQPTPPEKTPTIKYPTTKIEKGTKKEIVPEEIKDKDNKDITADKVGKPEDIQAPEGITVTPKENGKIEIEVPKDYNKDKTVTVKFKVKVDGKDVDTTVTITIPDTKDVYQPEVAEEKIKQGGKVDLTDNVTNKKDLPEGTKVEDITEKGKIDTNTPGKYVGKIKVTYPDGTSDEVEVPVTVTKTESPEKTPTIKYPTTKIEKGTKKEIVPEEIKDKDNKDITADKVGKPEDIQAPEGITVTPKENGKIEIEVPKDYNKDKTVTVKFKVKVDGKDVDTTVTITIPDTKDVYQPEVAEEKIKQGGKVDLTDNVTNKKDLPEGTKVEDITEKGKIDTNTPGKYVGKIKVTYPDGTSDEVEVPVTVTKTESPSPNYPLPGGNSSTDNNSSDGNSSTNSNGRISGNDRVDTAIRFSQQNYTQSDKVIVVDSGNYPDALTASVLAKVLKCPILLNNKNYLEESVKAEIQRLKVKDVIVVGGRNSISNEVKDALKQFDNDGVERIAGADRYKTSVEVAKRIVKISGNSNKVVIASGETFPDALSVSPFAGKINAPILLVRQNVMDMEVRNYLNEMAIQEVYITGGTRTISSNLESQISNVRLRFDGSNRYETAVKIAKYSFKSSKHAYIVSGEVFPDALVVGAVAAQQNSPILLTSKNTTKETKEYLNNSSITDVTIVGGLNTVKDSARKDYTN